MNEDYFSLEKIVKESFDKRDEEIKQLNIEINQVKDIMNDLNIIVRQQDEKIDTLLNHIEKTNINLNRGVQELKYMNKNANSFTQNVMKIGLVGGFNIIAITTLGFKFIVPIALTSYILTKQL